MGGVQVLLDLILGEELGVAADTCCKDTTEEGTPDSTSCQHSSSDPELATHLCGLQHDIEMLHTSGPARLWRSPSRACPCSSSWTYRSTTSVQRVLRPGKSYVLARSPGQAGAEDSRAYRIVTTTAHLGVRPFARESNFAARPCRPPSRASPP